VGVVVLGEAVEGADFFKDRGAVGLVERKNFIGDKAPSSHH
jgi:hypothetical protein